MIRLLRPSATGQEADRHQHHCHCHGEYDAATMVRRDFEFRQFRCFVRAFMPAGRYAFIWETSGPPSPTRVVWTAHRPCRQLQTGICSRRLGLSTENAIGRRGSPTIDGVAGTV